MMSNAVPKTSDWQPLKDAAEKIALQSDVIAPFLKVMPRQAFRGSREGSSNRTLKLPASIKNYPDTIACALSELRLPSHHHGSGSGS